MSRFEYDRCGGYGLLLALGFLLFTLNGVSEAEERSHPKVVLRVVAEIPTDTPGAGIGVAGPLAGTENNVLILAGGANFPGRPPWEGGVKYYDDAVHALQYDKTKNTFRWLPAQEQKLPRAMAYAACVQTPAGIVCCGGENERGPLGDVFRLRWNSAEKRALIDPLPELPRPRTNASAVLLGQRVYLLGGEIEGAASDSVLSLDLSRSDATWKKEPDLPMPVSHAQAVVQSDGQYNRIYVLGGRRARPDTREGTEFYASVRSWRPGTPGWTLKSERTDEEGNPYPFAAGGAIASGISTILLFGGDTGTVYRKLEEYSERIRNAGDEESRRRLQEERKVLLENHPGFCRDIYSYNTITDRWCRIGEMPFDARVTTPVVAFGGGAVIPSGEIRPGVHTPEIVMATWRSPPRFGWINYGVLLLYAIAMISLGFLFNEKGTSTKSFFIGSGRIPWWVAGISIFATTLSAITFLSMPAKAFATDWKMVFANLGIFIVAPFIIRYYLPFFRRLKTESAYEYLELRFNLATRWIASALFCLFMVARIAIVLYLPSLAVNVITGMNIHLCIICTGLITIFYCTLGGMNAVVWGDVIQGATLVLGALFSLLFLIYHTTGAWEGYLAIGSSSNKFHALDLTFLWSEPVFWVVMTMGIFNSLITYSSDQTIIQRYMTTKTQRLAARSIRLNAFIAIPVTVLFFMIGTGLYTYYYSHPELFPLTLDNNDGIYPYFIVNSLPAGLGGILVSAVFAAAMSTLSSNINSTSAAVCCDFVRRLRPGISEAGLVLWARATGIVVGLAGIAVATIMVDWDIKSLWDQFNSFLGLFTGALGGLFLIGIFSKRINGAAALCGVAGSFFGLQYLMHHTDCSALLYGFFGIAFCYGVAWIMSFVLPGEARIVELEDLNEE